MYDSIIKLVHEERKVDEYGDLKVTYSDRIVFAELKSIGQSEFYQAQAAGLKPEVKFIIPDFMDYLNEQRIKYTPYGGTEEEYTVLRTYRTGNRLEIVCKKGID